MVVFPPEDFGMKPAKVGRVIGVNDTRSFESPRQLFLVRTSQQPQFPTRRDIQSAMTQRVQQGMSIGIFIEMETDRPQAGAGGVRSRLRQTARSSSREFSISCRCKW